MVDLSICSSKIPNDFALSIEEALKIQLEIESTSRDRCCFEEARRLESSGCRYHEKGSS